MYKAVVFGGTIEGRKICEDCEDNGVRILYCVATEDGAQAVSFMKNISINIKRLNADEMSELLDKANPAAVIDATHPYAIEAGRNIKKACGLKNIPLIHVGREKVEKAKQENCIYFSDIESLTVWLEETTGAVFSTLGVSAAKSFSRLSDYQNRVWLRILPSLDSLKSCLEFGYHTNRLICMQGPFSDELNRAMFQYANAEILVTKDSGTAGGFNEKINAAQLFGMKIAVLSKPEDDGGVSLETALEYIRSLKT